MIQRAYSIRLYPTAAQTVLLSKTFGCCRKIYNCMLEARKKVYELTGQNARSKPTDFYESFPFLKEVDSNALTAEVITLNAAFRNFFKRKDDGVGFPKFKTKHKDKDTYTTYRTKDNIRIEGRKLRLPKVGFVSFRNYADEEWASKDIKHVTVKRSRSGKYFASVMVEEEAPEALPITHIETALDLGLHDFAATDCGEIIPNPKFLEKGEARIASLQRVFSHMTKGSKGREAMRVRIAREHEHVANQRKDFLDKLSSRLIRENQTVYVEDLDVKGVAESDDIKAKMEHDAAWRMFLNMLDYKAARYGRTIVRVGRWFPSSQLCHCCGFRNPDTKDLNVREWVCPRCGETYHRDINAALNILAEGRRIFAGGTPVQRRGNLEAHASLVRG